jgi:hypothetical protein
MLKTVEIRETNNRYDMRAETLAYFVASQGVTVQVSGETVMILLNGAVTDLVNKGEKK